MLASDIDQLVARAEQTAAAEENAPLCDTEPTVTAAATPLLARWSWHTLGKVLLLACGTGIAMIAMRNCSTKQWRQQRLLEEQLRNLKAQSVTMEAKVMSMGRASQVEALVRAHNLPLLESSVPPRVIQMVEE